MLWLTELIVSKWRYTSSYTLNFNTNNTGCLLATKCWICLNTKIVTFPHSCDINNLSWSAAGGHSTSQWGSHGGRVDPAGIAGVRQIATFHPQYKSRRRWMHLCIALLLSPFQDRSPWGCVMSIWGRASYFIWISLETVWAQVHRFTPKWLPIQSCCQWTLTITLTDCFFE